MSPSPDSWPPSPRSADSVVTCAHCGEPLWSSANRESRPSHCPQCGQPVPPPAKKKAKAKSSEQIKPAASMEVFVKPLPDVPLPSPPRTHDDAEEYGLSAKIRLCPKCQRELPDEGVLCTVCGYNSETGEQVEREYAPVQRSWEGVLSLRRRLQLFAAGQVIGLLGIVAGYLGDYLELGLFSWGASTFLFAYVLGTYPRIDVTRMRRGYATLTKTWRVFFVPLPPADIPLGQYAGVAVGKQMDVDGWDWAVLCMMLCCFLVPGILWWYLTFHQESFYVTLTKEHGALALQLYKGFSQEQAQEMAHIIQDVAGYR